MIAACLREQSQDSNRKRKAPTERKPPAPRRTRQRKTTSTRGRGSKAATAPDQEEVTDSTLTTVTAGDDDTQAEDGGDLLLEEEDTAMAAMEVDTPKEPVESQQPETDAAEYDATVEPVESTPSSSSTLAVSKADTANEGDEQQQLQQKVADTPEVPVESAVMAPATPERNVLPVETNDDGTAATNHSPQPNGHPVSSQPPTETLEPSSLS